MSGSTSTERAGLLDALSEAVESGAGLPAVARAAARLLDASVALIDRSSAVLAVAGASSDQEQKLLSGGEGVTAVELRVADTVVGELRYRAKAAPDPVIARMVTTLLALELERSRSPEWESEEAAGAFVRAVLRREVTDRRDIVAQASELGADLDRGAGVVVLRAAPRAAQTGEWRERVLVLAQRALRALAPGSLAASDGGEAAAEIAAIVPAEDDERLARAAAGLARELDDSLAGFHLTVGRSRRAADPVDLYRAGSEAQLAVNVGEAEGRRLARLRGHRRLPPAAAGDERGPGRARTLLRRDGRARWSPTTSSTRPSWSPPSRPTSTTTATSPPPPNSSSPTATRSATASSASATSAATTSAPPRAARSWDSA